MPGMSPLTALAILWGIVTAVLAVALIYRSIVAMKEDDGLFLGAGEANLEREQQQVQARLRHASKYTRVLGTASGVLLATITVLWAYQEYNIRLGH
jgi:ABC-type Fe3+ transport system permease subunit